MHLLVEYEQLLFIRTPSSAKYTNLLRKHIREHDTTTNLKGEIKSLLKFHVCLRPDHFFKIPENMHVSIIS
jgi:hypothetical protein